MTSDTLRPSLPPAPDPIWPGFSPEALPIQDPLGTQAGIDHVSATSGPESDLALLRKLLAALGEALEPAEAVKHALHEVMDATGATVGSLWLHQRDGTVVRVAHAGLDADYLGKFAGKENWASVQQEIVGQSDVVRLRDGAPGREYELGVTPPPGTRAIIVVPLRVRGMRAGAILLGHPEPDWAHRRAPEFLRAIGEAVASTLDRTRTIAELRTSNDLHENLLNAAHDAIVLVDLNGIVTEVNAAFERLLDRPRKDVTGRPMTEFLTQEDREGATAELTRLFETCEPVVQLPLRLMHRQGTPVPTLLNATLLRDANGVTRGSVGVFHDERDRRAAESSVRQSHETLELMLRHLDVGVAMLEVAGLRIERCNPAFERIFGTARELAAGLPEPAASSLVSLVRQVSETGSPASLQDLEVRWPDREAVRLNVTLAPMHPSSREREDHLVLALTDVTERRVLEERYRHAQKLEAVGTLAGGIAHEFNNLLTAILGNVTLALLDLPADHPLAPGLRDSEAAAQRAADLTRQLLGFGRRTPIRPRSLDVRMVIEESLPLLQHAIDPRIVIERDDAGNLWPIEADPGQLGQALMNLFVNARDAMPEGGRLVVRTSNRAGFTVRDKTGDYVCIEVTDTGTGIPADALPRIYEPFYTTKGPDRGTGLGLAVVHGILEQHGGWIDCESEPDRGTTFRMYLPRLDEVADLFSTVSHGETLLVVDDEEAVRGLARFVLERLGYRVLTARDGRDAVDVFRVHRDRIDLVVLDQTMPRMSGLEAMRELRDLSPKLRIVLTSGYEPGSGPQPSPEAAADGFLPKPYPPGMLGRVVREVLDSRP